MSEELDNELKKRISEVFEHYEDTAPAEEGWQLLREKFPLQKKERRVIPMWLSVAAVLLVLSLFGVWFFTQKTAQTEQVVSAKTPIKPHFEQPTTTDQKAVAPRADSTAKNATHGPDATGTEITKQQLAQHKANKATEGNDLPAADRLNGERYASTNTGKTLARVKQNGSAVNLPGTLPTVLDPVSTITTPQNTIAQAPANKTSKTLLTQSSKVDSIYQDQQIAASASQTDRSPATGAADIKATDPAKVDTKTSRMERLLASEQSNEDTKKRTERKDVDKRILYSIYAGSFFNYAEGSKSQMNAGAGFSTDIKLAGKLKLTTGVAIARNSLSYNGRPSSSGIVNDAIGAIDNSKVAAANYASAPNGQANTSLGIVAFRVVPSPSVSAYNVALTGLDIPLNLKYELNGKRSDAFISAGISSGTFINETFNYSYDNGANALGSSTNIPDASTSKSFASFDLARTLNVSVGMGYQITKGNRLFIEPFLKYPLNGMGSQQLRFGAGGINLRLKFQTGKK